MRGGTLIAILLVGGLAIGLFYLMNQAGASRLGPPALPNTQDQSFLTGASNTLNQATGVVDAGKKLWDTLFPPKAGMAAK